MMKKTKQLAIALALVAVAMPAGRALAGPIGQTGTFNQFQTGGGYSSGSGGEFTVYNYTGLSNSAYVSNVTANIGNYDPSFQTFCLEIGEYTANPSNYVIASGASNGGVGGSPDPISKGTSWLYSQFAAGTLTGYFTGTRATEAGLLQNAIWYLEQEGGSTNAYTTLVANMFGGLANAMANADVGENGVYVLNNTSVTGGLAQDFLYKSVPDGGATLAMLGGALMGLGLLRRKFSI